MRYADDFEVKVSGTKAHAKGLRGEVAAVLSPMGLRLSEEKTLVVGQLTRPNVRPPFGCY